MKKLIFSLVLATTIFMSCGSKTGQQAIISTDYGDITIVLYDETPQHRDNFIKLVKDGFYDDLLFHRVMQNFMIQGGDPNSKDSPAGAPLGSGGPGYTINPEIGFPHFRGTLAAARTPGPPQTTPSSGSQFYLIHGQPVTDAMLDGIERRYNFKYSPEQRSLYKEIGGRPDLDMNYTVYGEIISGIEVVDKIAAVSVNQANRPLEDVKMRIRLK